MTTSSYADSLGISGTGLVLLRDLIHERTGIFYENGRSYLLVDKVSPLIVSRGLTSLLDYYYVLKYDAQADAEWQRLMDALSVPETFFWRSVDQIDALTDILVPRHFAQPGAKPLTIWSAACSTGEEPLTIAMSLNEKGWFNRAPIEIIGSDASPAAITTARQGEYRERSFRNLPPVLRAKYFSEGANNRWRASPAIHSRIRWANANLTSESEIKSFATADVIFCRNVFIYFSETAIMNTLKSFYKLMPSPAYLFVAAAELSIKLARDFELAEVGGALAYVKR